MRLLADHEKNLIALEYLIVGIGLVKACIDLASSAGLL